LVIFKNSDSPLEKGYFKFFPLVMGLFCTQRHQWDCSEHHLKMLTLQKVKESQVSEFSKF